MANINQICNGTVLKFKSEFTIPANVSASADNMFYITFQDPLKIGLSYTNGDPTGPTAPTGVTVTYTSGATTGQATYSTLATITPNGSTVIPAGALYTDEGSISSNVTPPTTANVVLFTLGGQTFVSSPNPVDVSIEFQATVIDVSKLKAILATDYPLVSVSGPTVDPVTGITYYTFTNNYELTGYSWNGTTGTVVEGPTLGGDPLNIDFTQYVCRPFAEQYNISSLDDGETAYIRGGFVTVDSHTNPDLQYVIDISANEHLQVQQVNGNPVVELRLGAVDGPLLDPANYTAILVPGTNDSVTITVNQIDALISNYVYISIPCTTRNMATVNPHDALLSTLSEALNNDGTQICKSLNVYPVVEAASNNFFKSHDKTLV